MAYFDTLRNQDQRTLNLAKNLDEAGREFDRQPTAQAAEVLMRASGALQEEISRELTTLTAAKAMLEQQDHRLRERLAVAQERKGAVVDRVVARVQSGLEYMSPGPRRSTLPMYHCRTCRRDFHSSAELHAHVETYEHRTRER